jgi:hypothetical protein
MAEQNYANHVKWVPAFHFFLLPMLVVNVVRSLIWWYREGFGAWQIIPVLFSFALMAGFFSFRLMILRVQDRVVRLEERLRMSRLLPADLQPRIEEFTVPQLVGLRYASDEELPELARKVLSDKIMDAKTIKQSVKHWRPDYLRA